MSLLALRSHTVPVMLVVGLGLILLDAEPAFAQEIAENDVFEPVLDRFRDGMAGVQGRLAGFLTQIFISLAIIEMTWALTMMVLHDQGLQGIVREFIYRLMFIGVFAWFLQEGNATTMKIVDSFRTMGSASIEGGGIGTLAPDDIIDLGLYAALEAYKGGSIWSPVDSTAVFFAAFAILVAMIVVASVMIMTLLEFWIVGLSGFVLLALGGSRWTSDFAVAYLKYAVSVGMKLFILLVIAGLGYNFIRESIVGADYDRLSQLWVLVTSSVLLAIVSWTVPKGITSMIAGVSTASGLSPSQVLRAGSTTVGALASGGVSAAAGASAATAAGRLGSVQSGNTGVNAIRNLARSAAADVGSRMTGRRADGSIFPSQGRMGARMASGMNSERKSILGSNVARAVSNTSSDGPTEKTRS